MNLGERIYELRSRAGLSQGELADRLDVSRQAVSKWENNSAVPELDKLLKMSELFEISLDGLVKGTASESKEAKEEKFGEAPVNEAPADDEE
jgi:transcriptional regulator with XRE-family HTH domain